MQRPQSDYFLLPTEFVPAVFPSCLLGGLPLCSLLLGASATAITLALNSWFVLVRSCWAFIMSRD
ncbi:uncharacterized protein EDB91DRAFT_1171561 [Suillus paluster]|uniref:uncharacterized protein n=1 Tax=Suillus paluster TaxID=48578 RepID=UPI001B86E028|nr:uncharacterized protein EDB91DRAFT_1171561 [Suillus paluster]KAG1724103.1 hypothetical protein EDB91DRAFT_1171561 [Suillus paluster]